MTYVLKCLGLADGRPTLVVGAYLADYDPDGDGQYGGRIDWTIDPAGALTFPSAIDALRLYGVTSTRRPLRSDGKPNRPLTAYTVAVEPAP